MSSISQKKHTVGSGLLGAEKNVLKAFLLINIFIFISSYESILDIPKIVKYLDSPVALFILLRYSFRNKRYRNAGRGVELIILFFVIYSVWLLMSSIRFELYYVQEFFAGIFYYLPYLTPIIILHSRFRINFFIGLIHLTKKLLPIVILSLLVVLVFFRDFSNYPKNVFAIQLFTITPFLLFVTSDFERVGGKISFLLTIYYLGLLFLFAYMGRRGESLEVVFFLVAGFLLRVKSGFLSRRAKKSLLFSGIALSVVLGLSIYQNSKNLYVFERGLSQEGFEKSRGETVDMFFMDFGKQPFDWFVGRGLNGLVQKFDRGAEGLSRSVEIGYFNALLKGGLLYLIPMMVLYIHVIFLGYYRSKNVLAKALATIVLWQVIEMVSFGMPAFNLDYTMVWVSVSALLSAQLRQANNDRIFSVIHS